MKNTIWLRWLAALALMLALAAAGIRTQSAQAQYEFNGMPSNGSSTTMIERGGFLYIVQNSTLHKVRTKDLRELGRIPLFPAVVTFGTPQPTATGTLMPTATPRADGAQ